MTKTRLYPFSTLALTCLSLGVSAASYEVVELDASDKGVSNFAAAINEQGQTGILVQTPFNPPIDISLLNLEENDALREQLNDPDAVEKGQISEEDLVIMLSGWHGANQSPVPKTGLNTELPRRWKRQHRRNWFRYRRCRYGGTQS